MSFLFGFALCALAVALLALHGGSAGVLWSPPALGLALLGMAGFCLLTTPLPVLRANLKAARRALRTRVDFGGMSEYLLALVQTARREGVLAIEGRSDGTKDPLLKAGLDLVAGSADRETILSVLGGQAKEAAEEEKAAGDFLERLAAILPGIGVLGTLVELVQMFYTYKGPQTLAPGLAKALLPVAYSACAAYLFLMPLSARVRAGSAKLKRYREEILQGVLAIQAGEAPFIARQRLAVYEIQPSRKGRKRR